MCSWLIIVGFMERPIQHLYPLELSCDRNPTPYNDTPLNPTVVEFRPRRDAVVVARQRIQDTVEQDTWMLLPKEHYIHTYFLFCYRVCSTCICLVSKSYGGECWKLYDMLIIPKLIDIYKWFRLPIHNQTNMYAARVSSPHIWHCSTCLRWVLL